MSDKFTELLSDHLDGELDAVQSTALEAHLESCADCRTTLVELRRVKDAARTLVGPSAPNDLWAGIASQIGTTGTSSAFGASPALPGATILEFPRRRREGFAPLSRFAVAAGIALLLVAAGAVFVAKPALLGRAFTVTSPGAQVAPETGSRAAIEQASFDPVQVESEISQLKRALEAGRGKLDPKTVTVLETNLAIIQKATEDAKSALAKDPANRDLQDYFATSVQRKLDFMKRTAKMAGV
jgi:anti-sigma factor RsiW